MSGDVFGNGLLLSPNFKLVAAFDHRHLFFDPSPDLASSYAERKRLFSLPRSSWADYNAALISRGGGVFPRDAKRIPVSPQVRALLDIGPAGAGDQGVPDSLTGEDLVKAVLRLPVDLLWNGGIGTYVKASSETHAEVGDSKNDAVRVDAPQLRARVVAEGGNLGFTQAARVEYALRGGKINTDFIDNAAGVDLSDHEVNIKIALAEAIRLGCLDRAERDRLLKEMTDEVCGLVLVHNRQHAQVISLEEATSKEDLHDHLILAQELTEAGLLEAKFERFPEAAELARRMERRIGLLRPELALLLALTKIEISRILTESPLLLSAGFEEYLVGYFPRPLRERFAIVLENHPLKREIAASSLVNELAERVGITFVSRLRRQLGVSVEEAVRAYRVSDLLLDGASFCEPLRDLLAGGEVSPPAAGELLRAYRRACDDVAYWLLRGWPPGKESGPAEASEVLEDLREPFASVRAWLIQEAPATVEERAREREAELVGLGAPAELAARAVRFDLERHVLPSVAAARLAGTGRNSGAAVYFALAGALRLAEVEEAVAHLPVADPDERTAARSLLAEVRSLLVDLTARALAGPPEEALERAAERWLACAGARPAGHRQALPATGRRFSLGSLMVLVERLRRLAGK